MKVQSKVEDNKPSPHRLFGWLVGCLQATDGTAWAELMERQVQWTAVADVDRLDLDPQRTLVEPRTTGVRLALS